MGGTKATFAGILGLVLAAGAAAQQQRADRLLAQQRSVPEGSLEWFRLGCELIDAQFAFDIKSTLATAQQMWQRAEHSELPGVTATSAALVGRALTLGEGPAAAHEWFDRAGQPAPGTPVELRVHHLLARANYLCSCDDHVGEVQLALQVIDLLADRSEREFATPRIRALAMATHVKGEQGLADLEAGFALTTRQGNDDEVAHLRPLVQIEERSRAKERGDDAAAERIDRQIQATAETQGNRRLLGLALVNRANSLFAQQKFDAAIPLYDRAEQIYVELGDRRMIFGVGCFRARHALDSGNLDDAGQRIEALLQLIDGRGLRGEDRALLQIRFEHALARRDIDLAAELRRQIEQHDTVVAEADRRSAQLRHEVAQALAAKTAAEDQLRNQREAADSHARAVRTSLGVAAMACLLLLSGVFWWSRRKLASANARLAEQMRDLQASEQAQRRLEDRMRALERTESLGRMAAGVAHDFNNILTSILGSAELLRTTSDRTVVERHLQSIASSGEQAARLCRHLQAYAGGSPPALDRVDLLAVARELLPTLHAAAGGTVQVRLASSAEPTGALADRVEVEQVLLNLVQNAKDAGATTVEIDVAPTTNDTARLTVRDDGQGMTAEVQQRIFDPFFTTRFPGRGLGLAVVHGIVRRHQGQIEVESAPGRGSSFSIRIPGAQLPEPMTVIPRPLPAPATPASLCLVVDDDPEVRGVLRALLESLQQSVLAFASGDELFRALPTLSTATRTIAFVDLTMPGMDGLETMRQLRAARPDVRVVLISGHPPDYVDELARGAAPDQVLAKPFTRAALAQSLAGLVEPLAGVPTAPAAGG